MGKRKRAYKLIWPIGTLVRTKKYGPAMITGHMPRRMDFDYYSQVLNYRGRGLSRIWLHQDDIFGPENGLLRRAKVKASDIEFETWKKS